MPQRWLVLVMDDTRLQALYTHLLERRGYGVHTTCSLDEASHLVCTTQVDLIAVDIDVATSGVPYRLTEWSSRAPALKVILLTSPERAPPTEDTRLPSSSRQQADLLLQKPLSPMEFGIQIDLLLDTPPSSTLAETSEVEREFDAIQREFVVRLDEDLAHLHQQWIDAVGSVQAPKTTLKDLSTTTARLRETADHFGFSGLREHLERFESFVDSFADLDHESDDNAMADGRSLLAALREDCQALQLQHPSLIVTSNSQDQPQTLLVIDNDPQYLNKIRSLGEQFMLQVRTATDLDEALHRVRTPLMTGVLLSVTATDRPAELENALKRLRAASPLTQLPIALIGDSPEDLDRIRSLWTGASVLASRPITSATFAQIMGRLVTVRRAQNASILVIEPQVDFAKYLVTHLDTNHTTVQCSNDPNSLMEELERHRPHLLIVDAKLPGASAFDICRTIRSVPRWQTLPIVIFGEESNPETRIAGLHAGADDVISKRIDQEELSALVTARLHRARMHRERADRDPLTGLLTRRAFLEQLAARLSEVERHERSLAFCLIDVDRFKQVNDHHGHNAGDRVLNCLGRLLRERFRIEDLRARWGGEEFAVVLLDEDGATARQALDRVRGEFSNISFDVDDGQTFHVTFSAGIAEFGHDGTEADSLLTAADLRLLRAKRAGRDTILTGQGLSSVAE